MGHRPGRAAPPHATPLRAALEVVGDRWTALVVEALMARALRFGDLQDLVPGIAPNVLTQRLRDLEARALVVARPYQDRPPRFVYELTEEARELASALRLLAAWGARHRGAADTESPHHQTCGSALETRWWCPTCEAVVADDAAQDGGDWL